MAAQICLKTDVRTNSFRFRRASYAKRSRINDPCCVCESHAHWLKFDELSNRDQQGHVPINVKPQGFGSLSVRSVPRVGILIVCDVPRLAILIVQRTFCHLHLPPGGHFDQLFIPRGREFEFFNMKMSKSPPVPDPPLPGGEH